MKVSLRRGRSKGWTLNLELDAWSGLSIDDEAMRYFDEL
jgi:hypothetical protein